MRESCGCFARSATVLTRAKAMSFSASFCVSAASCIAPNTSATRASVSARRLTRSTLVAKAGSAASTASPSTFSASTRHSRSLWIEIKMSAPSFVGNAPYGAIEVPHAFGLRAALVLDQRHRHPIGHGVEHGDGDRRAFPRALARKKRLEDRLVGVHAGGDVAHRDADARRRLGAAGD